MEEDFLLTRDLFYYNKLEKELKDKNKHLIVDAIVKILENRKQTNIFDLAINRSISNYINEFYFTLKELKKGDFKLSIEFKEKKILDIDKISKNSDIIKRKKELDKLEKKINLLLEKIKTRKKQSKSYDELEEELEFLEKQYHELSPYRTNEALYNCVYFNEPNNIFYSINKKDTEYFIKIDLSKDKREILEIISQIKDEFDKYYEEKEKKRIKIFVGGKELGDRSYIKKIKQIINFNPSPQIKLHQKYVDFLYIFDFLLLHKKDGLDFARNSLVKFYIEQNPKIDITYIAGKYYNYLINKASVVKEILL